MDFEVDRIIGRLEPGETCKFIITRLQLDLETEHIITAKVGACHDGGLDYGAELTLKAYVSQDFEDGCPILNIHSDEKTHFFPDDEPIEHRWEDKINSRDLFGKVSKVINEETIRIANSITKTVLWEVSHPDHRHTFKEGESVLLNGNIFGITSDGLEMITAKNLEFGEEADKMRERVDCI